MQTGCIVAIVDTFGTVDATESERTGTFVTIDSVKTDLSICTVMSDTIVDVDLTMLTYIW